MRRMLQVILLTATRLREASDMNRVELNADTTEWIIPAARHKSKRDFLCPLSRAARDVIAELPIKGRKGWVFTTDGKSHISGSPSGKPRLMSVCWPSCVRLIPAARFERWTTHDLETHRPLVDVASRLQCRPLRAVSIGVGISPLIGAQPRPLSPTV